jgi:hypothetical protein
MIDMQAIEWYGISGQTYVFHAYELPQTFPKGHGGTYIYCRWSAGQWEPLYVGHGEFSECIGDRHPEAEMLLASGATHVHLRITPGVARRKIVTHDLREALLDGEWARANYPRRAVQR